MLRLFEDSRSKTSEWSISLISETLTEFSQYDLPRLSKIINVDP
jgi:hypothetical protein